jgi:hypothetical protein
VLEASGAVSLENSTTWEDRVRTVVGLREDEFSFDVKDKMRNADGSCNLTSDPLGCNTGDLRANIFSPKFGLVLGPWAGRPTFYPSQMAITATTHGASPAAARTLMRRRSRLSRGRPALSWGSRPTFGPRGTRH